MEQFMTIVYELLIMLSVYLVAVALAAPVRRRWMKKRTEPDNAIHGLQNLITFILRPVLVLAVTYPVLWLLQSFPSVASWIQDNSVHVSAWQIFWLAVLVIFFIEGITHQYFALRGRPFPVPDLLADIIRGLLVLGAAFAVLRIVLGIDIAPLLASTALITAVVGFALQGVLGNLLAGMSLHVVRSVMPGDWIQVGDEVEGRVIQTNWRETRLRTRQGHIMIVPNSKVSASVVNNMVRPTPLRRHQIEVGASYADAPGEVIAALVEAAESVPEVLRSPAPTAYVVAFLDFGINYRLRYWTNRYFHRIPVDGDVGRMIWYKFKRRGIEIPFPMSDQLLNDFMAVVYNQRRLPPENKDIEACVADLLASDFCTQLCCDENGESWLSESDLARIAPTVRRVMYTRGETLFRQGDEGATFYVVVKGKLRGKMEQETDGPITDFTLGPGAVLGEMSLMTDLPRTATIKVLEETELLEFGQEAFRSLLGMHDDIPEILSRLVAERAAANAAAFEKLKNLEQGEVADKIDRGNILKRFLRMLGK